MGRLSVPRHAMSFTRGALRAVAAALRGAAHRLRHPVRRPAHPAAEEVTVSVVVPVKNAGPDLHELIVRMNEQKGFRAVEVVVVDSGSTDGSAERAESLGATVVRIAPQEFSHSHARNLGAERASGDFVLFTVQDALPPNDTWLQEMFSGLRRHAAAAASCGEAPRADSDLFYRVISWNHHRFMTVGGGDREMQRPADDDPVNRRRNAQISDTACLIGRDLFLGYRHRGNYAEDLDLGLRLMDDGYRLAFLAGVRIVHSHNRPAYYHLRRSYVEHLALFDMLPGYPMAPGGAAAAVDDVVSSCAALDEALAGPLRALAAPCSPQQVREAVGAGLRAPLIRTEAVKVAPSDYLDERTRALLRRLDELPSVADRRGSSGGSLVHGVAGVVEMICDYLEASSQPIVEEVLEEVKSALYKGWALHCGVRLASAYHAAPEAARDPLRLIHEELTRDV